MSASTCVPTQSDANVEDCPAPLGDWSGSIRHGQSQVPIVLHLQFADGGLIGTLDYPRHHQSGLPLRELVFDDGELRFSTRSFGEYSGRWSDDRQRIEGAFVQDEARHLLTLQRGSDRFATAQRPQTPLAPFPYRIEDLTIDHLAAACTLAGTLTLPPVETLRAVILLITGSGAMDRDQTVFEHKPFWVLADLLSRAGYAVLRLDDRGVGSSTGDRSTLTMDDELADMAVAADYLHSRAELASLPLGLIGHSMGALTAMRLAAQSSEVDFMISMAGSALPLGPTFAERECLALSAAGIARDAVEKHRAFTLALYQSLRKLPIDDEITAEHISELVTRYHAEQTVTVHQQANWIARYNQAWFRSVLPLDPVDALARIQCPILAIGGSLDSQVPTRTSLAAMHAQLTTRLHPDFQTIELPGLNHLFQTCTTGSIQEYAAIEESFAPLALNTLRDWLDLHVKPQTEPVSSLGFATLTPTVMAASHSQS